MSVHKVRQISAFEKCKLKVRSKLKRDGKNRLVVSRSSKHTKAQIICIDTGNVLAAASSIDKEFRDLDVEKGKRKMTLAIKVGEKVASIAIEKGITNIAFDRSGFTYHGRVKALADAARGKGIKF